MSTPSRALATRLGGLGTETAYNISRDAAALERDGHKVHKFHIGDLSFKPPQQFIDAVHEAMVSGKTGYCLARGILELRQAAAERCGKERGITYHPDEISVQPGGKPSIMKFLMTVMNEGDAVLYPTPGYPLYESLITFLGGVPVPYTFKDSPNGIELDMDVLRAAADAHPNIVAIFYNNMHNPTGHMSTDAEMDQIADLIKERNWWCMSDEAYFGLTWDGEGKSIASLPGMQERTVVLLTCSKVWAMTGMRCGLALGPKCIIDYFEQLSINDEGCTNQAVQWGAVACYQGKCDDHTALIKSELYKRRNLIHARINRIPGLHAHLPPSSFYLWVNATAAFRLLHTDNYEEFRLRVLKETGVSFCTREHFGKALPNETEKYIRFSFAGCTEEQINVAMDILEKYMVEKAEGAQVPRILSTVWLPTSVRAKLGADNTVAVDSWPTATPMPHEVLLAKARHVDGLLVTGTDKIDATVLETSKSLQLITVTGQSGGVDAKACDAAGVRIVEAPSEDPTSSSDVEDPMSPHPPAAINEHHKHWTVHSPTETLTKRRRVA